MKYLSLRSLLAVMCMTGLCVGTNHLFAVDEVPFPDVEPIEKVVNEIEENPASDLVETASWIEAFAYQSEDAYLYRIHKDAYNHLFAFSENGEVVQLYDSSKWTVHPSQRYMVLQWVQSDDLFIKPYSSCFSPYRYVLYNRTTKQAVEVNLINPPESMGAFTFHIVNIEPYARLVHLSDNTIWKISNSDQNFPYWQKGQRILIGVNNGWHSATYPHVLINVDMYKEPCSQGEFFGYPVGY